MLPVPYRLCALFYWHVTLSQGHRFRIFKLSASDRFVAVEKSEHRKRKNRGQGQKADSQTVISTNPKVKCDVAHVIF